MSSINPAQMKQKYKIVKNIFYVVHFPYFLCTLNYSKVKFIQTLEENTSKFIV